MLDKVKGAVEATVGLFEGVYKKLFQAGTLLFAGLVFIIFPAIVYLTGGSLFGFTVNVVNFASEARWLNVSGITCLILSTTCHVTRSWLVFLSYKANLKSQPVIPQ